MKQQQTARKGKSTTFYLILFIGVILLIATLPGLMIFTFVAFLPTFAAWVSHSSAHYALPFCIGICNMATACPSYITLIQARFSLTAVQQIIHDPFSLLIILGGASVRWVIYLTIPAITTTYYKSSDKKLRQELLQRHQHIKEIWGEEIPSLSSTSKDKNFSSSVE